MALDGFERRLVEEISDELADQWEAMVEEADRGLNHLDVAPSELAQPLEGRLSPLARGAGVAQLLVNARRKKCLPRWSRS